MLGKVERPAETDAVIKTRRRLLALLGGVSMLWSIPAAAQTADRLRRVGVLIPSNAATTELDLAALKDQLAKLGWVEGRNLKLDVRWVADNDPTGQEAKQILALHPDVILAGGAPVRALARETRSVPIVFVLLRDPVADGLVASLAHPGGNLTGFTNYDQALAGKWVELLKQIAPKVTSVAVLDPSTVFPDFWWRGIKAAAQSLQVTATVAKIGDRASIERAIATIAAKPDGGLIVLPNPVTVVNMTLILGLAAKYRLPAIYWSRRQTAAGGLISYGVDDAEQFRLAAAYVNRILRGEKPGDLPIQEPTTYHLLINLKTAQALGLSVPQPLLAEADQVIE